MKWLILLFPSLCFANEYNFTYHLVKGRIDNRVYVKVEATDWYDALDKGGHICVEAYLHKLPNASKEAIANACTNPDHILDDEFYY